MENEGNANAHEGQGIQASQPHPQAKGGEERPLVSAEAAVDVAKG
jgi:hypothetical protein